MKSHSLDAAIVDAHPDCAARTPLDWERGRGKPAAAPPGRRPASELPEMPHLCVLTVFARAGAFGDTPLEKMVEGIGEGSHRRIGPPSVAGQISSELEAPTKISLVKPLDMGVTSWKSPQGRRSDGMNECVSRR